jgi:DNA (cytosine-5)-methyltransferase 1
MWGEMARIIGEVRPRFAFVENSPMLITRGLERVLADLTAMGYDSKWGVVSASDIGANHQTKNEFGLWRTPDTGAGGTSGTIERGANLTGRMVNQYKSD